MKITDEQMKQIKERLEYLRGELRDECISYGEIIELGDLADYINDDDVELLGAINNYGL